jgi:hypothetical protein
METSGTAFITVLSSDMLWKLATLPGKDHPDMLTSMNDSTLKLGRQGKDEVAEVMQRQTLATTNRISGKEHLGTLTSV